MSTSLYLKQLELGPLANFVYLLGDKESRKCAVVDPGWDVGAILRAAEEDEMKIEKILITHGHPDHVNGVEALFKKNECNVYIQKKEAEFWKFAWSNLVTLGDDDVIEIGKIPVRTLLTPGHTPGSQCFLIEKGLISGDTLFIGSCGRVDLPGGSPRDLFESLQRLRTLNDDTILYPGHNYGATLTSTLRDEKKHNPYFQFPSAEAFSNAVG